MDGRRREEGDTCRTGGFLAQIHIPHVEKGKKNLILPFVGWLLESCIQELG